jgi:hypothetical protein
MREPLDTKRVEHSQSEKDRGQNLNGLNSHGTPDPASPVGKVRSSDGGPTILTNL